MCRIQRRVRMSSGVHWSMILVLLPASIVITYFATGSVDARTLLFWVAFVAVSEVIAIIINRISLICQYCGFDPILYRKNKVLAMQRVKETLEESKKRHKEQPLEKNAYASVTANMRVNRTKVRADAKMATLAASAAKKEQHNAITLTQSKILPFVKNKSVQNLHSKEDLLDL